LSFGRRWTFFRLQRSKLPLEQVVAGIEPLFLKLATLDLDTEQLVNQFCPAPAHVMLATFRERRIVGNIWEEEAGAEQGT
jgi:hypothetical protein